MTDIKPQVETVTHTKTVRREYVSNTTLIAALSLILFGLIGGWMTWVTTSILKTQDTFLSIQTERAERVGQWMQWRGQVDLKVDQNREKITEIDKEVTELRHKK